MDITRSKKFMLFFFFISFITLFAALSQYAAGAYFLDKTLIPLEYLNYKTLYVNWLDYGHNPDFAKIFQVCYLIVFGVVMLPIGLAILILMALLKQEEIHGSARWASDSDLAKSGLFSTENTEPSILLGKMHKGKFKNKFVQLFGQLFAGVAAPTRSGKGVSIVLPNLVTYLHSIVVLDIKLENFFKSGGFRQKYNHEVFLFCPSGYNPSGNGQVDDLRSHRWNPLDYIRREHAFRVGDILTITGSLYPITGDKNDVWNELAGKLFKGLTLWMLDTESIRKKRPSLPYLLSLTGVEGGLVEWMKREIKHEYLGDDTRLEFNNFISAPDETRGSILSNLVSPLAIFGDKVTAAAVSDSDFDFRDLRKKKTAIYIGIEPASLGKFSKLINLFFEQLINENTRTLPDQDPSLKYQCLLVMDEFASIGRVNQIAKSISFSAGYNLRYLMIYQNEAQLEDPKIYGKEGAANITRNLAAKIIFPPKEVDDSVKRLSDTLGTKTVKVDSRSSNKGKSNSSSRSTSLQKRPLMMPHEIVELGNRMHKSAPLGTRTILIKENQRPFMMEKIFYFDEPILNDRVLYSQENIPDIPLLTI